MTFLEFFNQLEPKSDKGTLHDYIAGYYDKIFTPIKGKKDLKIMEVGIQACYSVSLWKGWFEDLYFVGADITDHCSSKEDSKTKIIKADAYTNDFIKLVEDTKFDFIIEDGPHTLQTQLFSINNFYTLLKNGGKLIIEDIQTDYDLNSLVNRCSELGYTFNVFDLRSNKGRYDDIILEIVKVI